MSKSSFWTFSKIIFFIFLYIISIGRSHEDLHVNCSISPVAKKIYDINFFATFEVAEPTYIYSKEHPAMRPVKLYAAGITGVVGWIGTAFYLIAYLLLSLRKLRPNRVLYHLLNLLGAIGLTVHAVYLKDHPNMAVNIIWGSIALVAIFSMIRKK